MNEVQILLNIQRKLNYDIEWIMQSEKQRKEIVSQMEQLDTDFFPSKCNEYLFTAYIKKDELLEDTLEHLQLLQKMIETKLTNACDHEWTYDSIDLSPEQSQTICYCNKCEITKK
jgi:hypothetical protein